LNQRRTIQSEVGDVESSNITSNSIALKDRTMRGFQDRNLAKRIHVEKLRCLVRDTHLKIGSQLKLDRSIFSRNACLVSIFVDFAGMKDLINCK